MQIGFVIVMIFKLQNTKTITRQNISTYGIDNYCNLLAKDITITNSFVDYKVKLELEMKNKNRYTGKI